MRIGSGLDQSVQMGPLRDGEKKKKDIRYIEKGIAEGARLTLDGRSPQIVGNYPDTDFLGPTVFEDATPDMVPAQEEILGPVSAITRDKSLDQAIEMTHDKPFGNAASLFTNSGKWARKFQYDVECGSIGINVGIAARWPSSPSAA